MVQEQSRVTTGGHGESTGLAILKGTGLQNKIESDPNPYTLRRTQIEAGNQRPRRMKYQETMAEEYRVGRDLSM